jgi:hypothetical protein
MAKPLRADWYLQQIAREELTRAATDHELNAARAKFYAELDRLLALLAARRRPIEPPSDATESGA